MSRIGKNPVSLPKGVKVSVHGREVVVESGSKRLAYTHRDEVEVRVDEKENSVVVTRKGDDRTAKAMHGLTRALIANMVQGVSAGFTKELEITGVGWGATVEGKTIALKIGYADIRKVNIPQGIDVEAKGARIKISGSDKQMVGQIAAQVRSHRPPEPYNGKGIAYVGERVIRKAGKAFAGGG